MALSPEVQAQLEEQKKHCVFCKIIAGEMKSFPIYKDAVMTGMLDINPAVKGHALFMPLEHYPILSFLPPETFAHLFGKLPTLVKSLKTAMVVPGATAFIANGGAAGQQSPHFLMHLFPRERWDGLSLSGGKGQKTDLSGFWKSLNAVMTEHFSRNPGGSVKTSETYEDDLVQGSAPDNPWGKGHVVLSIPGKEFDQLDENASRRLFTVASYASSILFESLQAHGTNLILHTGESEDNDSGFRLHLLPRWQDDGLLLSWKPLAQKPDLEAIKSKLRDEFFVVEHTPPPIKRKEEDTGDKLKKILEKQSPDSEIERAISEARK
ncbi:HIT domain-containing protein [Candidatus Woesearchaeota archaeon]|nr:HIT domain-containing protein [Candidatus Woesearchaeota archaeon]